MRNEKWAVLSWALYDWANSAFATTVMAGFFPIFFKQFWSAGTDAAVSTARLGMANSISGILVALVAPLLGAIADRGSARKKFLFLFAYLGIVMTLGLYMVSRGQWAMAVILYVLANTGFAGANIFYDSLLVSVAETKKLDAVSALGFSLGYLGGGVLFALNVWMTLSPEMFGFADAAEAVRFSFLTVGIWWAVFSLPVFFFVKEPQSPSSVSGIEAVTQGIAQLRQTFKEIRSLKNIFLFLAAYWLYIDGVDTVIRMAVDYGISIGLASKDLIRALLITQFVGFPSALAFGYMGARIGPKKAILGGIAVYLFISIWGAFMSSAREFYILAVMVGLVQGGIQALSRSFYARLIPPDKTAEYFGFYNMLGKFAAVLGPALISLVVLLVRQLGYSSEIASRVSISSISIFFITGGILLYFVDEEKGRQEVESIV
ncbi:MAG: MFS transporter [Nitrospira sp.]|nr:MFS transporter [bacterium]MBL7048966.1 MFS transporter [Nitrospira sp.]